MNVSEWMNESICVVAKKAQLWLVTVWYLNFILFLALFSFIQTFCNVRKERDILVCVVWMKLERRKKKMRSSRCLKWSGWPVCLSLFLAFIVYLRICWTIVRKTTGGVVCGLCSKNQTNRSMDGLTMNAERRSENVTLFSLTTTESLRFSLSQQEKRQIYNRPPPVSTFCRPLSIVCRLRDMTTWVLNLYDDILSMCSCSKLCFSLGKCVYGSFFSARIRWPPPLFLCLSLSLTIHGSLPFKRDEKVRL